MKRLRGRRAAFTLVELLVVIAIITVLIAIILPVFSRARERARQTACMANLYQLAMAVRMYRMDMGAFPGPYDPVTGEGGLNALYPAYVGSRKVFVCPDDITDVEMFLGQKRRVYEDATTYREVLYHDSVKKNGLLDVASSASMYADIDPDYWVNLWQYNTLNPPSDAPYDPTFFIEHYSSYNDLYNWVGYVGEPRSYSLLNLGQQYLLKGDNLAFWSQWYRWDPENVVGVQTSPDVYYLVDAQLAYHLAQQTYWSGYDPNNLENGQRLQDSLRRALWDPGNPDQTAYDYMPHGMPSPVFPGLVNRNAPENTIITRCSQHRSYTGSTGETQKDIALRLDGSCALLVGMTFDWAVQPQQGE